MRRSAQLRPSPPDPFEHFGSLSLEFVHEHLLALKRPAELPDIERVHALEPVEVHGVVGHDPNCTGGPGHPFRQPRRDRERVWPTARAADDGESLDAECVRESGDVVDAVDYLSA